MYKRLSVYLGGKFTIRTLKDFCVIESLSMVVPDINFEVSIMSVIVTVHNEKKVADCQCAYDETKQNIIEVPYEEATFFDRMK